MNQSECNTIAFVGLGNMGSPMVENLLEAGLSVNVFDLVPELAKKLESVGAKAFNSLESAVENVDAVITMLPAGEHVRAVYLGDHHGGEGLLKLVKPGTFLIDSSTIEPDSAKLVAKEATKNGLSFVDAPVSGGVAGAKAGTLTFIVGGTDQAFETSQQILAHMGKNIFHAGQAGDGQMAKICNNLLLGIVMSGTCEALSLGIDNGLNPEVLSNIIQQSSGRNWVLELYNPCPGVMESAPASNQYAPGFMSKLMSKDLGLGMQAAANSQSAVPMGALARNLYAFHNNNGNAELDFSSLFEYFRSEREK